MRRPGSAGERLEVAGRDGDLGERVVGVVLLHHVPLHAGRAAGLDNLREGKDPLPRRGVPGVGSGGPILHVEQAHAIGGSPDLGDGIPSPDRGPVDVELELDIPRQLGQEDVPGRGALERGELERVVVVADPDALVREGPAQGAELRREASHVIDRPTILFGHPGHDEARASDRGEPRGDGGRILAQALDPLVRRDGPQARLVEQPRQLNGWDLGKAGELDGPVAGRGDGAQGAAEVGRRERADGVELQRDLVDSHDATIRQSRSLRSMEPLGIGKPLGIGIVGTGNIAGGYARDILTHPEIRLVSATDLDPVRAAAFADAHGCRVHASLDALLADEAVDIVVNLTVHHAHYEVTRRALQAGRHVYTEKPLALRSGEARELIALAAARGLRLGCSPSTFLGEAQQTAAAWIGANRLGTVRAIYADVSWGRIETWHPAPAAFFDVGVMVDVAVYPLTLATTMVGPARTVRAWGWNLQPDRVALDGTPFRIGSPDLILAAVELEGGAVLRLTASFYVGDPVKGRGALEFHGDAGSLALGSFQDFDAPVEAGPYGGTYAPLPYVRPPFAGIAWARGLADMAAAIAEGRPHRASAEQAAHVVDILEAAATSMAADGRPVEVTSTFAAPALMPWASTPASGG